MAQLAVHTIPEPEIKLSKVDQAVNWFKDFFQNYFFEYNPTSFGILPKVSELTPEEKMS